MGGMQKLDQSTNLRDCGNESITILYGLYPEAKMKIIKTGPDKIRFPNIPRSSK